MSMSMSMNERSHDETAPVEAAGDARRTWSRPELTVVAADDASNLFTPGADGVIGS